MKLQWVPILSVIPYYTTYLLIFNKMYAPNIIILRWRGRSSYGTKWLKGKGLWRLPRAGICFFGPQHFPLQQPQVYLLGKIIYLLYFIHKNNFKLLYLWSKIIFLFFKLFSGSDALKEHISFSRCCHLLFLIYIIWILHMGTKFTV